MYAFKTLKQSNIKVVELGYYEKGSEVTYKETYYSDKNTFIEQFVDVMVQQDSFKNYNEEVEFMNNWFNLITKEKYESMIGTESPM